MKYYGYLSPHYATYAEFVGGSLNKERITKYCYSFQECYENKDKPFFKWRNNGVHLEYKKWLKKQMEII